MCRQIGNAILTPTLTRWFALIQAAMVEQQLPGMVIILLQVVAKPRAVIFRERFLGGP
jgi:hypothetical protein